MHLHKILVTGCGGDIGYAIGRILRNENLADILIGADIHQDHPGLSIFDSCEILPRANELNYFDSLWELHQKEQFDIIIPASEAELRLLANNNFFKKRELFLTANLKAMKIGFDKYTTIALLNNAGCPHPWTLLAANSKPKELPCIRKSRWGCGSKKIAVVTNENIQNFSYSDENDIWQELISTADEEYTCGLYRTKKGTIRNIVFQRKLKNGLTGSGKVIQNSVIVNLLHKVAEELCLEGSINVQLRLSNGVPMIFEINPRFSSTVAFRHKLGFKDLIWSLKERFNEEIEVYTPPENGVRIYKIYDDIVINPQKSCKKRKMGGNTREDEAIL